MAIMYRTINFNVRERDVNLNDFIRPATVLDYFQDIAGIHATELGVGFKPMLDLKLYWVILYVTFEKIGKMPKFGDVIKVNTWPKMQSKLEFEREYEIRDLNDNLLIKGISNWCVINSETRRLERAEKVKFNGEYYDKSNYDTKCKRKLGLIPNNIIKEYDYKVHMTDLDHNMHLNNARYLDIVYNMMLENGKKDFKKCEIAYISEARLNDIIHVKYFKEDNKDLYLGYVNDELCFEASLELED